MDLQIFNESEGVSDQPCRGCKRAQRRLKTGGVIRPEITPEGWTACTYCDVPQRDWDEQMKANLK